MLRLLTQSQQPLVLGRQSMPDPDPTHTRRVHLDSLEQQLVRDSLRPVRRMLERVLQDRLLHFLTHPIRVRAPRVVGARCLRWRFSHSHGTPQPSVGESHVGGFTLWIPHLNS